MYQVVMKMWVDDVRQADSIYTKMYAKRGFAERKAKELTGERGNIKREAYVRPVLKMVTPEEAKRAYCRGYAVYVSTEYGQEQLTPSGWYGSHAPESELFHRSVNAVIGWWKNGETNYWVEF